MKNSIEEYVINVVTDQLRLNGLSPEKAAQTDSRMWFGFAMGTMISGLVFVGILGLALTGAIKRERDLYSLFQ